MSTSPALPEQMRTYLENARIALAVSTVEGDAPLIFVNDAFCDLTGFTREEALGQNCRFLQGPETTEESRRALQEFVQDSDANNGRFPVVNYRKDGTRFHNYVFMTRLRNHSGETRFILASQFDMTTALERAQIGENDEGLGQALSDVEQMGKEFGLAMVGSAKMISDSVALMARLSLETDGS